MEEKARRIRCLKEEVKEAIFHRSMFLATSMHRVERGSFMKKVLMVLGLVFVMALTSTALADYTSGDDLGIEGMGMGVVISKNATIRSKASYNGKKLASVPGGTEILLTGEPENGWRKVQYVEGKKKQVEGWMREEYVVQNPIILTLRKSNIPAYSAPSHGSKLVGSLAKYTQLYVIGIWDEFYVVSLRDASAFIPIDAAVWTSVDIKEWLSFSSAGYTTCETTLRTGPGEDWPEAMTCKKNTPVSISNTYEEGDWYFVFCDGKPAFAKKEDVQFK